MDIFAGSGTTLKMAKLNNRKFIGFEISREYCDIIEKRLENLSTKTQLQRILSWENRFCKKS